MCRNEKRGNQGVREGQAGIGHFVASNGAPLARPQIRLIEPVRLVRQFSLSPAIAASSAARDVAKRTQLG
jgi:hypothetical protein